MFKMKQARSRRSVQRRAACVNQIEASGMPLGGRTHRCLPFQPTQKAPSAVNRNSPMVKETVLEKTVESSLARGQAP